MKRISILVALSAVALLVSVGTAPATTSPTNVVEWKVELTNTGVQFTPDPQVQVGMVGLFKITNKSTTKRWFSAAGRRTHLLARNGFDSFYVLFASQGRFPWRSSSATGKTFTGVVVVAPCTSNTGSCNGTTP